MKILVTGATGLIGRHLCEELLDRGHSVHYLTTRKNLLEERENYRGFYWNPMLNEIDERCIEGVEVIVHLAGASIAQRWTASAKLEILNSRTKSAILLFQLLKEHSHNVRHFVSASGIGIYPPSLTKLYTETSPEIDPSFVGEVVKLWEESALMFESLGLKVTMVRTGLVLSADGGALPKIAGPIKKGIGAPIGSGKQWQSWIHIADMSRIYIEIIEKGWTGIYNAVAPNPVTNKKLTKTIAKVLNKPLWLPKVPGFVLKVVFGKMASLVLQGQLVQSDRLLEEGFQFEFFNIESAISDLMK